MESITVVGGGLGGLTAAIAAAEQGASVDLYEGHQTLGGRARSSEGPYTANDGPHVFYDNGPHWSWLASRGLVTPAARAPLGALAKLRFRHQGRLVALPPSDLAKLLVKRKVVAPVDRSLRDWAGEQFGAESARLMAGLLGAVTFDHDAGRLSAAFGWERFLRTTALKYPSARYVLGGWQATVGKFAAHARQLGVRIHTGHRVDTIPDGPTIVATSLDAARQLLGDDTLRWESGRTALLDLAVRQDKRDLFLVFDLDQAAFYERFSAADPSVVPAGESLVQAQQPLRPGESKADGIARLEGLIDLAMPGWRDRVTWRREAIAHCRTGALDLPGTTWRDRPAIDRGDGVYLVGDQVAAPGLLSEVAIASAREAAKLAVDRLGDNLEKSHTRRSAAG
ncbi:NAD(P)-binding protein [Tenggerimyces flavus]|uniref:NAD(P)-binding protein n=1 Tax=Tenggerimyces flavus TaxID=1708749 RepID=A0ABV7YPE1_9ACTN|nr:NAD(P)-binding protein [Tenggerimyces flavus]MBM7784440.1 phytoene dehydrogenase-like protein [Tenggerimyces flavus]